MKILGYGTFGLVRMAEDKTNPFMKYAIKTVQKEKLTGRAICQLKREIEALMSVDHPNIIQLYETFEDENHFHLVMEVC